MAGRQLTVGFLFAGRLWAIGFPASRKDTRSKIGGLESMSDKDTVLKPQGQTVIEIL